MLIHTPGNRVPVEIYEGFELPVHTVTVTHSTIRVEDIRSRRDEQEQHKEITRFLFAGSSPEEIHVIQNRNPTQLTEGEGCSNRGNQTTVDILSGMIQYRDTNRIVLMEGHRVQNATTRLFEYECDRILILPPSAATIFESAKPSGHPLRVLFDRIINEMSQIVKDNELIRNERGEESKVRCNDLSF